MPRYVILQHTLPSHTGLGSHYDLMLEGNASLVTWSIPDLPRAGLQTTATKLPDHRLAYLDYEGPVSGQRGEVRRVASGSYVCREWSDSLAIFELHSMGSNLFVCELRHKSGEEWIVEFRLAD